MRKYGKWVLTLSLLAATPGLTLAAGQKSKDPNAATPARSARPDNQRVAEDIANALRGKVKGDISIEFKDGVAVLSGTVLDAKVKKTAESLTENVAGVTKVDNRLAVVEAKASLYGPASWRRNAKRRDAGRTFGWRGCKSKASAADQLGICRGNAAKSRRNAGSCKRGTSQISQSGNGRTGRPGFVRSPA